MQPRLRFKGFNSNWKLSTLGQLMTGFSYGLCASATKYNGRDKYLRITDIDDNNRRFNYDNLSSPGVDLSNKSKYLLKQGDIVFARTGASVGKAYLYNKKDGRVYYAGFLIRANSNKSDKIFLFNHTFTQKYWNFIRIYSMRSGQPGINTKALKSFKIAIPTLPEQRLIGKFFAKLDKLISLQQAKCSLLKKQKRGYLQKLFPKKNEDVPRFRFKGFHGKWKSIKLGDIANITKFDGPAFMDFMKYSKRGHYIALRGLNVVGNSINLNGAKFIDEQRSNLPKLDKLYKGDIVFRYVGTIGPSAVINENNKYYLAPNLALIRIETDDSSLFIHQLISTKYYYGEYIFPYINASSRLDLNMKLISNFKLKIPSIPEQHVIGSFFNKFDNSINLQNDKLHHLRKLKKAYLQKMFC